MISQTPKSTRINYRAIDWTDFDAGLSRQIALPGVANAPGSAEHIFLRLCRKWLEESRPKKYYQTPRLADEMAFAALLLVCEFGSEFTPFALLEIKTNIALCEHLEHSWMDSLIWKVAGSILDKDDPLFGFHDLYLNLDHQTSYIRIRMLEIAWIIRSRLIHQLAMPRLLENLANKIIGVEMSWGLVATFFDSEESLNDAIKGWQPSDMSYEKQYQDRLKYFNFVGVFKSQADFLQMENNCWQLISVCALY